MSAGKLPDIVPVADDTLALLLGSQVANDTRVIKVLNCAS